MRRTLPRGPDHEGQRSVLPDAERVRVRSRVGVTVGNLPLAILTPVDLRRTENVLPGLAADRRLRSLVTGGERHLSDHIHSYDLVLVGGAVRECVAEAPEQVANLLETDRRASRAEHGHGLPRGPDRQPRSRVAVVQRDLGIPQPTLCPRHEVVSIAHVVPRHYGAVSTASIRAPSDSTTT